MNFNEIPETSKVFHNSILEEEESGRYRIRFVRDLGGSKVPEKYQSLIKLDTGWDLLGIYGSRESAIMSCIKSSNEEDEALRLLL